MMRAGGGSPRTKRPIETGAGDGMGSLQGRGAAPRREEFLFLLIISLVLALRNLGLILVVPVLAVFADTLEGSTPALAGLAIGVYGLTQALFQIPFGRMSDRIGRRRVVAVGLLLFCAGNLLAGLAHHIFLLVAGRALMGSGAIASVCFAWISDRIPGERRNRSFGLVTVAASVAAFIGFFFGPILYSLFSLSYVFFGCAALGLVSVGVLYGFLPERLPDRSRPEAGASISLPGFQEIVRMPYLLLHCGMGLFMNYFMTSLFFAVPYELKGFIEPETFWKIITPIMGGSVLVMIPAMRWADKGGVRTVIQLGFILECLCSLLLLAQPTFPRLVLSLALFVSGYVLLAPSLPSSLSSAYDSSLFGSVMGWYSMSLFLGSFLGATVSGCLYPHGLPWIGACLAALALAGGWMNHVLRWMPLPLP